MPMLDIQRRHAEVFRLRFGDRGPNGAPRKLTEAIRITAPTEQIVAAFVDVYGGTIQPFDEKTSRDNYQAYLPTTSIAIMVLPGQSLSQWWERYRGSVCDRRCDGEIETKSGQPCMCPPDIDTRMGDKQACSPTTRVSVLCPDVAVVGSGSFVTHGLIAAETLPQAITVAETALSRGLMVPATLMVSEVKGRTHFIYPQIAITGMSLHELVSGGTSVTAELGSINGERLAPAPDRHLIPVPAIAAASAPSVAEQVAAVDNPAPRARRANAAEPLPSTGLRPRTLVEANAIEPDPEPPPAGTQAYSVTDLARLATRVFHDDYDAAPKGDKTKTVDRLRHAAIYACTKGRTATSKACSASELARTAQLLNDISQGRITYIHDQADYAGVTFTLASGRATTVLWTELEEGQPGAGAELSPDES